MLDLEAVPTPRPSVRSLPESVEWLLSLSEFFPLSSSPATLNLQILLRLEQWYFSCDGAIQTCIMEMNVSTDSVLGLTDQTAECLDAFKGFWILDSSMCVCFLHNAVHLIDGVTAELGKVLILLCSVRLSDDSSRMGLPLERGDGKTRVATKLKQ